MTTTPVYDMLVARITDALERKLLDTLLDKAGESVSRLELVEAVHGPEARALAEKIGINKSTHDRQNREIIERLQAKDYPIVSSSGEGGYTLAADDETTEAYIKEIGSRIEKMQSKQAALRRSTKWIKFIREWRACRPAIQGRLL